MFLKEYFQDKNRYGHSRVGNKGEFKICASPLPTPQEKEANRQTIFHQFSVPFSPSQLAQGLSISFLLACLEPITDAEISAFDGYQSETGNGLGASRPRQEEMSESGEPNSAILEII